MVDIVLRKAILKDSKTIAKFNVLMAEETENKELDINIVFDGVKAAINDEDKGFYLVAEKPDVGIIGQLMVTFEWSDWRNKWFWWIQSVYVAENYRSMKVFSKIYRQLSDLAKNSDVYGLRLYVKKNNTFAKKIYKKLGMKNTYYEVLEYTL